jgi:hypothetical protein
MKLLLPVLLAMSLLTIGCSHHHNKHHDKHKDGPGNSENAPGHNKHKHKHHDKHDH